MTATRGALPLFSVAEAVDRLQAPTILESVSPLSGVGGFAIDLDHPGPERAARVRAAVARLAQLPCPTLGLLRGDPSPDASALAAALDVLVDAPSELDVVWRQIEKTPLAALAWVHLLRENSARSVYGALMAESFAYSTLQSGPEFQKWLAERGPSEPAEEGEELPVQVRRAGDRLILRLDRPRHHNAFSRAMRDGLVEGLLVAASDPSLYEIQLQGEGPSFCSGGDLREFGSFRDPATAHAVRSTRSPAFWMSECGERVRAELHGACIGAGIELAAFARQVVAEPDAFFELPELSLGLIPGAGGSVSLPKRIGRQRTAWLGLSGARIDVDRAHRWGLVDEIRDSR